MAKRVYMSEVEGTRKRGKPRRRKKNEVKEAVKV